VQLTQHKFRPERTCANFFPVVSLVGKLHMGPLCKHNKHNTCTVITIVYKKCRLFVICNYPDYGKHKFYCAGPQITVVRVEKLLDSLTDHRFMRILLYAGRTRSILLAISWNGYRMP